MKSRSPEELSSTRKLREGSFPQGREPLGGVLSNRLKEKVAVVTGGDQGIGRAIAERIACEGADVAICYRKNKQGADEVVEQITSATKRRVAAFQADIGKISDGQQFIEEAVRSLGKIDILVNNAGLEKRADFWDVTEADFDAVLNVTINSIAPGAIETPINTKLLNDPVKLKELLENIPLGRLGKPEDVAGIASFLASDESDYVTGSTFFVDGGLLWNYQEQ